MKNYRYKTVYTFRGIPIVRDNASTELKRLFMLDVNYPHSIKRFTKSSEAIDYITKNGMRGADNESDED